MFTDEVKKQKGFTLIEVLVSMFILMLVMLGFLVGILQYTKYTLRNQYRNEASKIVTQISQNLYSLPLNSKLFVNRIYPDPSVDSDNDGIAKYCDADELVNVSNHCNEFDSLNFPESSEVKGAVTYKGVSIKYGIIILPYRIPTTPQPVYACVLVWYRDPTNDNRCEYITTLVVKGY